MAMKRVVQARMWKEESGAEASVRYGTRGAGDVCWRIYLRKDAYEKLGKPDEVRVTIEAADKLQGLKE
jgi:hypothetical protein